MHVDKVSSVEGRRSTTMLIQVNAGLHWNATTADVRDGQAAQVRAKIIRGRQVADADVTAQLQQV
jgi:hypothetical protein